MIPFESFRRVALVAALGYRGGRPERGLHSQRSATVGLLCQGTSVGSNAIQPMPPRGFAFQSFRP